MQRPVGPIEVDFEASGHVSDEVGEVDVGALEGARPVSRRETWSKSPTSRVNRVPCFTASSIRRFIACGSTGLPSGVPRSIDWSMSMSDFIGVLSSWEATARNSLRALRAS